MDIEKIEQLIEVLENSKAEELAITKGEFAVHVRKGSKPRHSPRRKTQAAPVTKPEDSAPQATDFTIVAPMVGIFHAIDGISKVGSGVYEGQVVGAIESMKLLNDVVSGATGQVIEVMVTDGTPVEYGQPLCRIELAEVPK